MTLEETLISHSFEVTKDVNTCNAWGFGGAIKNVYENGEFTVNIGKAYFRHAFPAKFITVYKDSKRIFDLNDTKSNRQKLIDFINKNSTIKM